MRLIGVSDDESVFNQIKNDIGINVGTNEVRLWQIKNKKDIEDKGISIYMKRTH